MERRANKREKENLSSFSRVEEDERGKVVSNESLMASYYVLFIEAKHLSKYSFSTEEHVQW
jgi:hypothetical protein